MMKRIRKLWRVVFMLQPTFRSARLLAIKRVAFMTSIQIREGAYIGRNCILSKGVYVDSDVSIGDNVKIQNYVSIYRGVIIEDGVFVGPHVCFTNDIRLYAKLLQFGSLKAAENWQLSKTLVRQGAALGANSTVVCGVTIGALGQWLAQV